MGKKLPPCVLLIAALWTLAPELHALQLHGEHCASQREILGHAQACRNLRKISNAEGARGLFCYKLKCLTPTCPSDRDRREERRLCRARGHFIHHYRDEDACLQVRCTVRVPLKERVKIRKERRLRELQLHIENTAVLLGG